MKKLLLSLTLALAFLPSPAQTPRARDFSTVTDSLQVRLKRRTGVTSNFKLEKVLVRGNALDFYFSQNLLGQPYRKGDITWLTEQIQELGKGKLGKYKVGNLYARGQRLAGLSQPQLTALKVYEKAALHTRIFRGSVVVVYHIRTFGQRGMGHIESHSVHSAFEHFFQCFYVRARRT